MTSPRATITEDLTSQVNGFTATFMTGQAFLPGTLNVALNGQRLRPGIGNDFVEASTQTFTMLLTPDLGEVILVQYESDATETGFPLVVAYTSDPGF